MATVALAPAPESSPSGGRFAGSEVLADDTATVAVTVDGDRVSIDVTGSSIPVTGDLGALVRAELGRPVAVDVWLTQRALMSGGGPTTTTTTSASHG